MNDAAEALLNRNLRALRALRALEAENRPPTPEEAEALADYAGWADADLCRDAFNWRKRPRDPELAALLPDAEPVFAARVFSPPPVPGPVAEALWRAAEHLRGGREDVRVLDPCAGAGEVTAAVPSAFRLAAASSCPVGAAVLERRAPGARVIAAAPSDPGISRGAFDLVAGAAPASPSAGEDDADLPHSYLRATRSGWFAARSLLFLRPGGVALILVPSDFLDGDDRRAREWVASRAELLLAARLPQGAAGVAGTWDALVLRRRRRPDPAAASAPWLDTFDVEGERPGWNSVAVRKVSAWYRERPELLLGAGFGWSPEEHALTLLPRSDEHPRKFFRAAAALTEAVRAALPAGLLSAEPAARPAPAFAPREPEGAAEVMALDLWRAARRALEAQVGGGRSDPAPLIAKALRRYQELIAVSGPLRAAEANPRHPLRRLINLPEWGLLRLLELPSGGPSQLLKGRSVRDGLGNVSLRDPAEALAASLDLFGRPDVGWIAGRLGTSVAAAEEALGDDVFRCPSGVGWRHAPEYLSGDVRARLREARAAANADPRFLRNAEALERVVPPPVDWAEVKVPLGASWVPAEFVRLFASRLCGRRDADGWGVSVSRAARVGTWIVNVTSPPLLRSVENVTTWGAPGMPATEILQEVLNLRSPVVYETVEEADPDDPEKTKKTKRRDEDATAAAAGKAEEIRAEWDRFVREEPAASRLSAIYQELFGGYVRRKFSGSYLTFPGLSLFVDGKPFEPRRHQRAFVERLSSRSEPDDATLGAHRVGYGKTFSGLAGAIRRLQIGASDVAVIVVPSGKVFSQWREAVGKFFPLYADRFLFGPENWARDSDDFLRRVAAREASIVLLTYDQCAAVPSSSAAVEDFLMSDVLPLREALADVEKDASRKEEKKAIRAALGGRQKAADRHLEAHGKRLAKMLSRGRLWTWEEVFPDPSRVALIFDEWQYLKRVPVQTKMERVAGLPRGEGSFRAVDALVKVARTEAEGGFVAGLSGTPITNTMAEVHVSMRFFQRRRLAASGLEHFDDWASVFTEPVVSVEMDAVGGFRPVTRLRFVNLPEMLAMLAESWDFAEHVEEVVRPDLIGGGMRIVEVAGSDDLAEYVAELAERAEAVRAGEVEPSEDNMLKITSDGRRAAMWNGRPAETFPAAPAAPLSDCGGPSPGAILLPDPDCPECFGRDDLQPCEECNPDGERRFPPEEDEEEDRPRRRTKLDAAADVLWETYREHFDERGVCLVFCDLGTPKGDPDAGATPEEQFRMKGIYGELRDRLVSRGVLPAHVAFVHDAKNDAETDELFRRVNAGEIRILVGSTDKLGVGTNPQRRVVMVLHLDAPWRPDQLIQRGGRGRRDGNLFDALHEVAIVTSRSYDVCIWQLLQVKAEFIAKVQEGDASAREADDVGDLVISASMAKAIALGDDRVLEKVKAETSLALLARQKRAWEEARARALRDLAAVPARVARYRAELEAVERASALRGKDPEGFRVMLRDVRSPDLYQVKNVAEADARAYALSNALRTILRKPIRVGEYRGRELKMEIRYGAVALVMDLGGAEVEVLNVHATGTFAALDRDLGMIDVRAAALRKSLEAEEAREAALRAETSREWPGAAEANRLRREYEDLCAALAGENGLVDRRAFAL